VAKDGVTPPVETGVWHRTKPAGSRLARGKLLRWRLSPLERVSLYQTGI
jgi:hypothetical protein